MAVIREHLQTLVTGSNDRFGIMSIDIMGKFLWTVLIADWQTKPRYNKLTSTVVDVKK